MTLLPFFCDLRFSTFVNRKPQIVNRPFIIFLTSVILPISIFFYLCGLFYVRLKYFGNCL